MGGVARLRGRLAIATLVALAVLLAMLAPTAVLAASPEPTPSATSIGGGLGEAVGIGPPALGLLGIVGGIVVVILLGRLARRRWPEP